MEGILELVGKHQKRRGEENAIAVMHHVMMRAYGYIPLVDLEEMPIPTALNLMNLIAQENAEMEKSMDKTRRKANGSRR